jgi:hypothetical protein
VSGEFTFTSVSAGVWNTCGIMVQSNGSESNNPKLIVVHSFIEDFTPEVS